MKIRCGFVSNSSSSSFVVSTTDYKDVKSLAIKMMRIRNEDWIDDHELAELTQRHTETQDPALLKEIKENLKYIIGHNQELTDLINSTIDPDTPITFRTTNYDTFIVKLDNYLLVSTCNNHDWSYTINKINCNVIPKESLIKLFGDEILTDRSYDVHDTIELDLKRVAVFWWTKYNAYIKCMRHNNEVECQVKGHYYKIEMSKDNKEFKIICPMCEFGEDIG